MKFTKTALTKFVVAKVASYGTGIIVSSIIANNVFVGELTLPKKVAVLVAGAMIASAIQGVVVQQSDNLIDSFVEAYAKFTDEQKKAA